MDWTNSFKQNEINEFSNNVLNSLLDELVNTKLSKHLKFKIKKEEIILLYRWSFYISVNTFTDRLLRVLCDNKFIKNENSKNNFFFKKRRNIIEATLNLYNNNQFNDGFLHELYSILNTGKINNNIFDEFDFNEKNKFGLTFVKKKFNSYNKKFIFLLKFFLFKYIVLLFFKPKNYIIKMNN